MQPILDILSHCTPRDLPPPPEPGATIARMRTSLCRSAPRVAGLLACAAIASPLAGCGGSKSPGKGSDPATAVPASAPVYVGAIVRPTGTLQANAQAAGKTLTRQPDPYLRLLSALQTPGSPPLDFKRDLAPWLGAQAGVFLGASGAGANLGALLALVQQGILSGSAQPAFPFAPSGSGGAPAGEGAFVLESTNAGAARSFLSTQASHAGAHPNSYRGVSYEVTGTGLAFGLVGRFAVIGSESALRGVIDTNAGGPSLARSTGYSRLAAVAPSEALAHAYASGAPAAGSAGASRAGSTASLLALLTGAHPTNISLLPSASALTLDADTLSSGAAGGLLAPQGEAARAVGELPGESYLALGFAGTGLTQDTQALRSLFSLGAHPEATPGISVKGLLAATLAPVALLTEGSAQSKREFESWMGPGALFASGSGLIDLKAGVVISSNNPAASRAAVGKLASRLRATGVAVSPASIPGTDAAVSTQLSGLPIPLVIANGRDAKGETKLVIGLGEASITAALTPSSTLSSSSAYGDSAAALGEGIQPSLIAQVPTLLGVLEGAGLSEDPTLAPLLPVLRTLNTVSGGGKGLSGGIERFRVVLGLRGG